MAKIRSLKQYYAKYKKTKAELLQFTKKELEAEAKLRGCDVDYLLKGRKWIKVGDTYCEIPRLFSLRWIKNIRTSVKILTCSLLTGGAVTAVAVPVTINMINNTIESSDGSLNIRTETDAAGDRVVHISAKDSEKRVASFTIKKGNVELKEGIDYTVNVVSIDETVITIKKDSFEKNSGRLVITPTLEIKCSITLDKTHIKMNMKDHTTDKITATVVGYTQIVKWTTSNPSICTVSDGNVTAVNNGDCVITAEANGKTATCSINVYTAVESVSLDHHSLSLNLKDVKTATLTPTINPQKTSIDDVKFEIVNGDENIKLSERTIKTGNPITVTALKNGNARIRAYAEGKEDFCDVNINTELENVILSENTKALDLAKEPSFNLSASVDPAGATIQDISWTVIKGNDVVSIDKDQTKAGESIKVQALANGKATVKATAGGKEANCEITVDTAVSEINFNKESLTLSLKDETTKTSEVIATIAPETATIKNVNWEFVSGSDIVSMSPFTTETGNPLTVTALKNGKAKLKASAGNISKEFDVSVDTPVEKLTLSKTKINDLDLDIEDKKTTTIYATISPEKATKQIIKWEVVNSSPETGYTEVIKLDKDETEPGETHPVTITAMGNGTAKIKASIGDISKYCNVDVHTKVSSITFDPTSLSLNLTDTKEGTVTATVNEHARNKNINWSVDSASTGIIEINKSQTSSGETVTVKALANGDGVINVTSADETTTKTYNVTVATPVSSFSVSKSTMSLSLDGTAGAKTSDTIHGLIEPEGARDQKITWELVNPGENPIVELSKTQTTHEEDLTITAKANGTVTLKASVGGKEATCEITVDTAVTSIALSASTMKLDLETKKTDTIYATISPSSATTQKVKWKVTGTEGIVEVPTDETVSGEEGLATITAKANGTTTIVAYTGEGTSEVVSDVCTVTVDTAVTDLTISADTMSLVNNNDSKKTGTIHATITPSTATLNEISWSLSTTDIVSLSKTKSASDEDITVTALKKGTVTLTATVGTFSKTCEITVTTDVTKITCTSTLELCVNGETATSSLNVTVLPEEASDKSYTITSNDTTIASVENDKIKALKTGTVNLIVKSVSNEEVTSTCILTVTNPKLNWTGTQTGLGNKSPKTIASSSKKVIFGKKSDHESEIEGLTPTQVGERTIDEVYAYVKDSGTSNQVLYILSDGIIRFDDNDSVGMFQAMTINEGIAFENVDTSSVTNMSYMFGGQNTTYSYYGETLDLTALDTKNVDRFENTFYRLTTKTVDLSTWDTSKATYMGYMFMYCGSTKVYASDLFVTTSVTNSFAIWMDCDLVGQLGTKTSRTIENDKTYARIDREGAPGMFWEKS